MTLFVPRLVLTIPDVTSLTLISRSNVPSDQIPDAYSRRVRHYLYCQ